GRARICGVIGPLATAVISAALVMAAGTGLLVLLNRRPGRIVLGVLGAVEALVLAQVVTAVVLLFGGHRPASSVLEFLGYHLATVLVLPAGVVWSLGDRTRWSAGVLVVACLAVAVMTVRMNQLWAGVGAVHA
ncbi:MAG TPA: hypothetical protein VGJ13_12755, partial [Pseudonocardiaceae bacterium]